MISYSQVFIFYFPNISDIGLFMISFPAKTWFNQLPNCCWSAYIFISAIYVKKRKKWFPDGKSNNGIVTTFFCFKLFHFIYYPFFQIYKSNEGNNRLCFYSRSWNMIYILSFLIPFFCKIVTNIISIFYLVFTGATMIT